MVLGIFQKYCHIVAVVFLRKNFNKSSRQLHHLFGHPEIFLENKKLQDSGLEIDVISASGPVKQQKWHPKPPFIKFIKSSMDQNGSFLCATLSMKKFIQSTSKSSMRFLVHLFSSRIPMFRTSQINRQLFPRIFEPPILSNKSGVDVISTYLTPEKKK